MSGNNFFDLREVNRGRVHGIINHVVERFNFFALEPKTNLRGNGGIVGFVRTLFLAQTEADFVAQQEVAENFVARARDDRHKIFQRNFFVLVDVTDVNVSVIRRVIKFFAVHGVVFGNHVAIPFVEAALVGVVKINFFVLIVAGLDEPTCNDFL